MKTIRPATARLEAASEVIYDDYFAVLNNVVLVFNLGDFRREGVLHIVDLVVVLRVVKVGGVGPFLHLGDAFDGQRYRLGSLVYSEVSLTIQTGHQLGEALVELYRLFRRAADDQRGSGFVDEDVIDFIHDGVVQLSLHAVGLVQGHIVPEIIETEFVVSAIGNVCPVGFGPRDRPEIFHTGRGVGDIRVVLEADVVLQAPDS